MTAVTLRADATLDDAVRGTVDEAVRAAGGTICWRTNARAGRTYAAVDVPESGLASVRAAAGKVLTLLDGAIIAIAVYPTLPEALPYVCEALAGPGAPSGVASAQACGDGVAIEWNPAVTPPSVVLGLVDVELGRFASARTAELLAPLTPALEAAIAADGLSTPEITAGSILDVALERAGIHV